MSKHFRHEGKSIEISGVSTGVSSGNLYRRTGNSSGRGRGWIGVVTDDIIGTSETQTTLDGRPIDIGDGVAAEAQTGEGKGDMMIVGVHTMVLPTSGMVINDSDPVYANFTLTAGVPNAVVASGVTNNQDAAFNRHPLSGACAGFAVGSNYVATSPPFTGKNVVDVKLLGFPQGLYDAAPSLA